jgi:hypothetical protein
VDQYANNCDNREEERHPEKGVFWITHEKKPAF